MIWFKTYSLGKICTWVADFKNLYEYTPIHFDSLLESMSMLMQLCPLGLIQSYICVYMYIFFRFMYWLIIWSLKIRTWLIWGLQSLLHSYFYQWSSPRHSFHVNTFHGSHLSGCLICNFVQEDLYAKICSLSYTGDLRMLFAEDKNKVILIRTCKRYLVLTQVVALSDIGFCNNNLLTEQDLLNKRTWMYHQHIRLLSAC